MSKFDMGFKEEVMHRAGGENLQACFSCGVCTAGCIIEEFYPEYNPRRVIRMVLLGLRREVLSSPLIWLCSTCYTCYERCPQKVKLVEVMNALKNIATEEGYAPRSLKKQVAILSKFGRLYEIDEFDNKRRVKLGLPEIKMDGEEIAKIIKLTGLSELAEDG
jgi:heterodisulfide reductase subunit C